MKDENAEIRYYTSKVLREIAGKSSLQTFIKALKDEDGRIRAEAIFALSQIGDKSVVPAIIESLKDEYTQLDIHGERHIVREAAIEAEQPPWKLLLQDGVNSKNPFIHRFSR